MVIILLDIPGEIRADRAQQSSAGIGKGEIEIIPVRGFDCKRCFIVYESIDHFVNY